MTYHEFKAIHNEKEDVWTIIVQTWDIYREYEIKPRTLKGAIEFKLFDMLDWLAYIRIVRIKPTKHIELP